MIIYVLVSQDYYEGGYVFGLYSSQDLALEAANLAIKTPRHMGYKLESDIDKIGDAAPCFYVEAMRVDI